MKRAVIMTVLLGFLGVNPAHAMGPLPKALPGDVAQLQACLSSRTADFASTCIGSLSGECVKTADSQQRLTACMIREHAVWDLFLNNDYQALMATLKPPAKSVLQEIEREFLGTTERRCAFIRTLWGYSSYIQVVEIERCWMQAKATQWLWLREFVEFAKPEKPAR